METPFDPFERPEFAVVPQDLRIEFEGGKAHAQVYARRLLRIYQSERPLQAVVAVARDIQSTDPVPGTEAQVNQAYVAGGLLGFRAANFLLGDDFMDQLGQCVIALPDFDREELDEKEERHQMLSYLFELGSEGFAKSGAYAAIAKEVEDAFCPDVTQQELFRRGFGFVMYQVGLVFAARHESDLALMRHQLEQAEADKVDWHQLLRADDV